MVILNAYFDETGDVNDEKQQFSGMVGCLAHEDKWARFEKRWKRELDDEDLPYFHMKEFAHSEGAFKKWKGEEHKPKRREVFSKLLQILGEVKPIFLGCMVPLSGYRQLNEDIKRRLVDPYCLSFQECFRHILSVGLLHSKVRRAVMFFDNKPKMKQHLNAMYDRLIEEQDFSDKIPPPVFDNWRTLLPLQAADIVAYETFSEYKRRIFGPTKKPRYGFEWMQAATRANFKTSEMPIYFYTKEALEDISETFQTPFDE